MKILYKILAIIDIALITYSSKSPTFLSVLICIIITSFVIVSFFKQINENEN